MGPRSAAERRVQQAFAKVGTIRGGELYVPWSVADRYIDACVQESLAILGVDVFRQEHGGKLRPDLNQIADFSALFTRAAAWEVVVHATASEARRFVEQLSADEAVLLSVTLRSEATAARG